ncbi:MAG: competence protein ComEC, partial [Pseudonocardiaceae bacterium]
MTSTGPDLRLVPAALAAWGMVLVGLHLGWAAAAVMGTAALLATLGAVHAAGDRRWMAGVLAAGGVAAATALVSGAHAGRMEHHPARVAAERGAAATVVVVLRDDPRPLAAPGYGGRQGVAERVVVRGELAGLQTRGSRWSGGGRVVLVAPAQGWLGLLPGQRVRAEGLLAPASRADLTVALVRVRGPAEVLDDPTAAQRVAERARSGLRDAA